MSKISSPFAISLLMAILGGLALGIFLGFKYLNTTLVMECPNFCTATSEISAPHRHFRSDDIMVLAYDEDKNPLILGLELNRRQIGKDTYNHYYRGNLVYKDINQYKSYDFQSGKDAVQSNLFFSSYKNEGYFDLSARETYAFELRIGGKTLRIELDDLQGDFITKNTPEYTKYISGGTARISIDGKELDGQAMISKIYSEDYSKYIFFDGYDVLKGITHYFVLWDENKNFYLIDTTKTEHNEYNYRSHTWVLYKNFEHQTMKKAFQVDVQFRQESSLPQSWLISIPALNEAELVLERESFFEESSSQGIVRGIIKENGQEIPLRGIFHYALYNQ